MNHPIHKNLPERLHLPGIASWIALLCFVAILNYLLQLVSFSLRLPGVRMTAIWIPGGLLLAAFLLTPTSRWWTLILAFALSFIAAFWSDRQLGLRTVVLSMPISFFAAALIARYLRGADGQLSFSTLRGFLRFVALQALAFLLAVQLPIASYQKLFGEPLPSLSVFAVRYLGEVLGCLFAAPAFALTAAAVLRRAPARRTTSRAELLSALVAYVTVAALVFVSPLTPFPALLFAPLPILLWGALRLGLEGVSWMLLLLAVVATFGAIHGHGPFLAMSPTNNLLQLQMFLIASGLPLQVLAAAVHERKVSSEALREGEERLRLAAQAGKMFAYEWDAATDAIVRSGESARILGIDEATPTTGQQILAKVHPDNRERLMAAMAELSPEKPFLQVSYRMIRPDGSVIWVERNSRAHFDAQGRIQRIVGMVADITERKLAEQAQREYEKTVEGSEEMIAVVDREYRYVIANRKFLNYRGMTKEQVVGRLAPEVLNPGVFESVVKERLDECFSGKVVKYEMKYTYPELGERDVFISYFPIEGSVGIDRVACIVQDITERKRADEALRNSEEWLRLAVQAGRMYAFEWDAATDVIVRSGRYAEVFNWMDNPRRDTNQQFLTRVHPDDRDEYAATEARLAPEYPTYQTHFRLLRPDGSVIWLEESGRAYFDGQGAMLRTIGMVADITERKRTEFALRESEERFRLVANTAPVMIWMSEPDKLCSYFNQPWLEFTGRTLQEDLGNGWAEGVHPEDFATCLDTFMHAFDRRQNFRMEYRLRRYDGEYRWILDVGVPRFNSDGSFAGYIGSCMDVTGRKLAEEALKKSEEKFSKAFRESPTLVILNRTTDGQYIEVNDTFERIMGYRRDEVIGRTSREVGFWEDPGEREKLVRQILVEGSLRNRECRFRVKSGDLRIGLLSADLIDIEGETCSICVIADITERKRADEALRKSEEWLRLAVQAGRMYAFEWDAATDVIVRSQECRGILDWMDDPTCDTARQFVTSVHPNDRERYVARKTLSPQNPTYQNSYRVIRPDGSVIWLETSGHVYFDGQGKVQRIIGMVTDVTERKSTEQALRESEERLRMAAQTGRMYAYEWDVATDAVVRSPECADLLGLGSPAHTTRREMLNCLHPDDHGMCGDLSVVTPQNPTLRARYRIGRQDGTWMWAEKTARAFFDEQGKMVRMIGMIADITERMLAEEALSSLSRRLIEAQEQERFRIARELHDDISHRMVLLQMGLDEFMQNMDGLKPSARELLQDILELASEVSSDLHNVSHQLHPARLDLIGLVATVADYCNEISRQHHLQVEFVHQDVLAEMPKDVALCLFRIVQEALRNIVKHSGATEAKVELSGHGHQINLRISDQGKGFDPGSAVGQAGLGLISMRERLRLVGGHLSVESAQAHGTRIYVCVPLSATDAAVTIDGNELPPPLQAPRRAS